MDEDESKYMASAGLNRYRACRIISAQTVNLDLSGLEPGQWRIVPREEAEAKLLNL